MLGKYNWCTFAEFEQNAAELSQGLIQLGLKAKDNVAIIAETRAEWLTTAYACYKNNLAVVTIYTNLGNYHLQFTFNTNIDETYLVIPAIWP